METVNIHEAKTHLSKLLERVEQGERFVIARAGKPIAELGPVARKPIVFGSLEGRLAVDWDAFEDADEEMDREVLEMFDEDLGLRDR